MNIPEEARLTKEEIGKFEYKDIIRVGNASFEQHDVDIDSLLRFQLAKAVPIIEAAVRKSERKRAIVVLESLLPLNGAGECWYCGMGNKPDKDLYHSDNDNVWHGDQRCLRHQFYKEAKEYLKALKEGKPWCWRKECH